MPISPIPFPLIQGVRTDHSSIDLRLNGKSGVGQSLWKTGLKSLTWDASLEPGEVRGAWAQVVGLTRGTFKANGSMELWKAEAVNFEQDLYTQYQPQGLLEITFPILLTYKQESVIAPATAAMIARMTKKSDSTTQGSEAHSTKYDLYIIMVSENGIPLTTGAVMPGVQF